MIVERLRGMCEGTPGIDLVGEADNEVDAMRGICASSPELVVLDLNLAAGGGNGMDVLRQIRQMPAHCTVIVLTNYFNPLYQKKCMDMGADYFMDKSQELEALGGLLADLATNPQSHASVQH